MHFELLCLAGRPLVLDCTALSFDMRAMQLRVQNIGTAPHSRSCNHDGHSNFQLEMGFSATLPPLPTGLHLLLEQLRHGARLDKALPQDPNWRISCAQIRSSCKPIEPLSLQDLT